MSKIQNRQIEEDEIDLIELFKKVYLEKKLIFKVTLFCICFWSCLRFISTK